MSAVPMSMDFHVVFAPSKRVSLFGKVWAVLREGFEEPLGEHVSRSHAEHAAINYAKSAEAAGGSARVVVHTPQGPVANEHYFPALLV